jgi:hypothetical protein
VIGLVRDALVDEPGLNVGARDEEGPLCSRWEMRIKGRGPEFPPMPKLIIERLVIPRSSGNDSARETFVIVTPKPPPVPAIATERIEFGGHPCQP